MSLHLYLDDCANSRRLAELLRAAGHTVTIPEDRGLTGEDDEIHFECARQSGMILVTKNPADFIELARSFPSHPGVFAIYQDNDVARDMSYPEIVAAIGRLEETFAQTETPLRDQVHILNHWRGAGETPAPSPEESPPPPPRPPRGKRKKPKSG